jgi:CheY-like chemotaxis protein
MAMIWICGHERDAAALVERVLRQLGHAPRVVAPSELLTAMQGNARPDLLMLDLREDVQGLSLLKTLAARGTPPRLLVNTTAAPASAHVAQARRMGAEVHYMRPLEIEILERAVAGLTSPSGEPEAAQRPLPIRPSPATQEPRR